MSKAKKKGDKNKGQNDGAVATAPATPATPATTVEPTGEAVALENQGQTEKVENETENSTPAAPKTKRIPKNFTDENIDPKDPESGMKWLRAFTEKCEKHPPRAGYDQHWNRDGFIHTGPSTRLTNQGAARMAVMIGDIFANRSVEGDTEADAFLDFLINFFQTRRDTLREEKNAAALAAAQAIIAAAGAKTKA